MSYQCYMLYNVLFYISFILVFILSVCFIHVLYNIGEDLTILLCYLNNILVMSITILVFIINDLHISIINISYC